MKKLLLVLKGLLYYKGKTIILQFKQNKNIFLYFQNTVTDHTVSSSKTTANLVSLKYQIKAEIIQKTEKFLITRNR